MQKEAIVATYRIETAIPLEQAAEMIAGEQSSGTFLPVPGETEELKAKARAKVLEITPLETVSTPSLPGSKQPDVNAVRQQAEIRIAFPQDNVGANIPTLLATVCGNLYELAEHSGCKLIDLELPDVFARRYPGPQFGVEGTRKLAGVHDRPIIGTIVKPSVGLSPEQTAALVRELGEAGIDFVKDDELMANPPHSPLKERVNCVMREINDLAERTGRKVMYAVNISDEVDEMFRHHDHVLAAGGTCVMVSLNHVGFAGVSALRAGCELPIHGHRNGWGMFNRHPMLGIEFTAYQKLWRAIGVDHLHVNGLQNKFCEPDESVLRSLKSLQEPMWSGYHAMPVISSGQWGGQAPETLRLGGTQDVIYVAGGGIMAHPGGPAAGLRGIQQAWEAATAGIALDEYAKQHTELRQALEKFGGRR
ncbi:MAG: ribulose-bisphosphate carboxylase large subunit family protein [Planctomycetales bacterium]|nr:ribulose-bisphosphate carboxylase large subunit family protein [Planctomycetales bacterium]